MPVLVACADGFEERETPGRGRGIFATRAMGAGEILFKETPLIAMQHQSNRHSGVIVCERCFAFTGPLERQVRALLKGRGLADEAILPASLPSMPGLRELPTPVGCPGGCGLSFCSAACATAEYEEHHCLLCPGPGALPADASESAKRKALESLLPPTMPKVQNLLEGLDLAQQRALNGDASASKSDSECKADWEADNQVTKAKCDGGSLGALPLSNARTNGSSQMQLDTIAAATSRLCTGMSDSLAMSTTSIALVAPATADASASSSMSFSSCPFAQPAPHPTPRVPTPPASASALERFRVHAFETNEIFMLAAKASALVLRQMQAGISAAQAMEPFSGPLWWEVVAPAAATNTSTSAAPATATATAAASFSAAASTSSTSSLVNTTEPEAGLSQTMHDLLVQSWLLLCPLLGVHAPAGCELFSSPHAYARIVGSFERRNCAVQVASPVEEYFLLVDAMSEGEAKRDVLAVTQPVLDALGTAYHTHCEGAGLFPQQAMLNHSCEPNVTLLKSAAEDERDGRVVASLSRAVLAGEELCNAYIDVSMPLRARQQELSEYGFVCDCSKCTREAEAEMGAKISAKTGAKAGVEIGAEIGADIRMDSAMDATMDATMDAATEATTEAAVEGSVKSANEPSACASVDATPTRVIGGSSLAALTSDELPPRRRAERPRRRLK